MTNDLYTLVRGELDAEDSEGGAWQIQLYFYDANNAQVGSYAVPASQTPGSLSTAWQEVGGRITTPAGTATVKIYLYNYLNSGWVAVDNVRLSRPTDGTIQRITYHLGGRAIATRIVGDPTSSNNGLFYIYSDHLNSNSVMSYYKLNTGSDHSQIGQAVVGSSARYLPFGGWRTEPTAGLTDRGYTSHLHNNLGSGPDDLGLIYMNARYYLPSLNRFISADTIIPNPANPQSFNRYSYVLNSPLNFTDPSGHRSCSAATAAEDYETCDQNLGNGADYGNVNLFDNAFPYIFLIFLEHAVNGEITLGQAYALASADTVDFLISFLSDNPAAQGAIALAKNITGGTLPSDWLGAGVREQLADSYLLSTELMFRQANNLSEELAESISTYRGEGVACSFTYETVVSTNEGYKPIGELEIGDWVLAYNEETEEVAYYPVTATWMHIDPVIVYLTIDGETIETTPNHPFFTNQGEWVMAGLLEVGDKVWTANWGVGQVEAITFLAQPQFMYNLTVDTAHTYFVGYEQWLVHNQCGGHYKGTDKPWTTGANPNSTYTQFDSSTGQPKQTAIYDSQGRVIVHIDWKKHGSADAGHWHYLRVPGDPSSGHGTRSPHYQPIDPYTWGLPSDWNVWP